uniref:Uncharacterized protein n=1 Tax=Anguilla anguilla TaxID=7936 RepID=A0A0E9ULP1_ANGAN
MKQTIDFLFYTQQNKTNAAHVLPQSSL